MRLFEAIIDANQRALAGDAEAGLHLAEFADALPVAVLTCIDARLNALFPGVLGLPKEQFIWLRNAGNIITGPVSSTMRSLALACAVKNGREIAIIGHTDCLVAKSSIMKLTEAFRALGVERAALPENLLDFFGLFASERQNVIKAVEITRGSPLIGPRIPVHGLMVDIATGQLEWVVNGYQVLEQAPARRPDSLGKDNGEAIGALSGMAGFQLGEMKFPTSKIGEYGAGTGDLIGEGIPRVEVPPRLGPTPAAGAAPAAIRPPPPVPGRLPLPPRIRPTPNVRKWKL